ncbi:hypothetical protein [Halocola ammonii]
MKNIHKHFKLLLLFGVFALFLFGCKKEIDSPDDNENEQTQQDDYDTYFSGKVNGEEFQYNGSWNCVSIYGTFYPSGFLDFEEGYMTFTIQNCSDAESLHIGKTSQLQEGVFYSTDTTDQSRPWCIFSDYDEDFLDEDGNNTYLNARQVCEIRLEITNIEHIEEFDDFYVEGLLDAVVQDTIVDSTIVISDVEFGYKF